MTSSTDDPRRDLAWAETLTNQSCAAGKHADWWVDSEYNHACPWCELASAWGRLVAAEAALADAERLRDQYKLAGDAIERGREHLRAQLADANKRIEELEAGGQQ